MKIIALGVNSAFAVGEFVIGDDLDSHEVRNMYIPKFQSNFLIEFEQSGKANSDVYKLGFDFGGDIRHSLKNIGLTFSDIDGWYCSHPHNDHIGGIEGIALMTLFNPFYNQKKNQWLQGNTVLDMLSNDFEIPGDCKPDMIAHGSVLHEIWKAAKPGLETLQGIRNVEMETFFNVIPMIDNIPLTFKDGDRTWELYTVISTHVVAGMRLMPSYGIMFECSDGQKIYMPTDTQMLQPPQLKTFYKQADVIYQDCETGFRSGVHAHIDDIRNIEEDIKKKCYLYHYDKKPEINEGEFKGILKTGDYHVY